MNSLTSAATDQARGLTAPFLQRVVQGLLRQLQRRDQAEDQRGCGGYRGDKGEHAGVHAGVGGPGYGLGTEHAERRGRPPANAHAGDGAEHADHEALGEKLRDETAARRTKRGADGELPLARGTGGEQQIRQVGARNQQHETDRRRQQHQALPGVADGGFVQRQQPHTLAVVAVRELLLEPGGDGIELGACGGNGRARRQPADAANEVPAAIWRSGIEPVRDEHVRGPIGVDLDVPIRSGQHADDGRRLCVQQDLGAQHRRTAAEPPLPEAVAQQHHRRSVRLVVLDADGPAQCRSNSEGREETVRDVHAADAFGVAGRTGDGERPYVAMRAHRGERARFALEIEVIARRQVPHFVVIGVEPDDADQRFGRGVRQGAEQDRLDQAEDGGVDADAEGQGADGHQRKAGPFDQTSQREADHHREIRR